MFHSFFIIVLFFVIKSKRTDHTRNNMSKLDGIFTENFASLFSIAGKIENVPEFEFEKFQKTIFWRLYIFTIYTVTGAQILTNFNTLFYEIT